MSKNEIKREINEVLDHFPDDALQELLTFLKGLEGRHLNDLNQDLLQKILTEDKTLLARLAQ